MYEQTDRAHLDKVGILLEGDVHQVEDEVGDGGAEGQEAVLCAYIFIVVVGQSGYGWRCESCELSCRMCACVCGGGGPRYVYAMNGTHRWSFASNQCRISLVPPK